MASIFTYDPDPPRVSSPWLAPATSPNPSTPQSNDGVQSPPPSLLSDYGVTRLEAEPQEGPTEYKLHLLLRPRRAYSSASTSRVSSHSPQSHLQSGAQWIRIEPAVAISASNQSRQNRLEQLTTQLLWRLQQSSPYHASASSDLVLPQLPDATVTLNSPARAGKLVAGLEESRGALYEIGVADDGTFVGLTKGEMDESLTNLQAMAASLGCNVRVLRMVMVGDELVESSTIVDRLDASAVGERAAKAESKHPVALFEPAEPADRREQLWVAEALVTPDLSSKKTVSLKDSDFEDPNGASTSTSHYPQSGKEGTAAASQLRITLTGPTTSGKSSLLGTLSTATLDNGRGKSRLSLLKHRHEIASGVTSSVAQELIGYNSDQVINYASGNVTTWTDIHASAENGRLVFVCDSAGHPRYRRTTVRGIIGWAPHVRNPRNYPSLCGRVTDYFPMTRSDSMRVMRDWSVLCIAADDSENAASSAGGTASAREILGAAGTGVDLANAHLELCLKLESPLMVVITKLDLASKSSLRQTVSKILSAVKTTGRIPFLLPPDHSKSVQEADLSTISENDNKTLYGLLTKIEEAGNLTSVVPIVLTSAAKGMGIRLMHALLQSLPISPIPTPYDLTGPVLNPEQPACLFHIEDVFGLPASHEAMVSHRDKKVDSGSVVAGHLRFGKLSVGDIVVIGPFPADGDERGSPQNKSGTRASPSSFGASMSRLSASEPARFTSRNNVSASVTKGEWHMAHIMSIRNFRLPVRTLEADQVGTIGIVFDIPIEEESSGPFERPPPTTPRIRKGMVLAIPNQHMIKTGHTLQAASGLTASFEDSDINSVTPGSLVVLYIASIRASAKVIRLTPHPAGTEAGFNDNDEVDVFGLDESLEKEHREAESFVFGTDGITDVTFELLTNREWIELGSQVLVMPGGGYGLYNGSERGEKGVAGLDGFVGKVIEVVD